MRALYARTATAFVKIMDTAVPELRQFLQSGDKQMVVMRLHTLKGNAGTLGATELAAMAAKLEGGCKKGEDMTDCWQDLAQFEVLIQSTQEKLRKAIALLGSSAEPRLVSASNKLDTAAALDALRKITALAAASDLDALQCFAERRQALEALPEEFVDRLDKSLQDLDLETAYAIGIEMLVQLPEPSAQENLQIQ